MRPAGREERLATEPRGAHKTQTLPPGGRVPSQGSLIINLYLCPPLLDLEDSKWLFSITGGNEWKWDSLGLCYALLLQSCLTLQPHKPLQAPLSMNNGVGCHALLQEIFRDPRIKLRSPVDSLPAEPPGKPIWGQDEKRGVSCKAKKRSVKSLLCLKKNTCSKTFKT